MMANAMRLEVSIPCGACAANIRLGDDHCPGCGRPATPDERAALQRRWEAADPEARRSSFEVRRSQVIIGIVAGVWALWGVVIWGLFDFETAQFNLVLAVLMALLFATSFRWPLPSAAGAAAVYLIAWGIQFAADPVRGLGGIIGKSLTLAALLVGCAAELHLRRARESLR
jgi:hypothetical protein